MVKSVFRSWGVVQFKGNGLIVESWYGRLGLFGSTSMCPAGYNQSLVLRSNGRRHFFLGRLMDINRPLKPLMI